MFRRMLKLARPWWKNLGITIVSLLMASLLNLVTPEAVRRLTAALSTPDTLTVRLLLTYAGVLLGAYLIRALFRFLSMWQAHIAAWNFVANLTRICYDKLQSLSMRYYSDKQT